MEIFKISFKTIFTYLSIYLISTFLILITDLFYYRDFVLNIALQGLLTLVYLPVIILFFDHLIYYWNTTLKFDEANEEYYLNDFKFTKDDVYKITRIGNYFARLSLKPTSVWEIELKNRKEAITLSTIIISEKDFSRIFTANTFIQKTKIINWI